VELLGLGGGMPTRVSVPRSRAVHALRALGVSDAVAEALSG